MGLFLSSMLSIRLGVLALIIFAASVTFSQTIATGEITGVVVDPEAKVVIGAKVQLKSADTGESRTVQSNASGVYRFPFVKPGAYEVSAKSQGLKSDTGSLLVAVGQVQVVDLHLKLEGAKTVVLVRDAAPLLDRDNDNFVYTLSTQQLDLLPLPGGDLVGVAYSVPGVIVNNRFGFGNFVVQGLGSVSNLFTLNGIDEMDPYYNINNSGTTGMLLGANEVQEASVVQNAFEGQYGRQAGAQVNYITKSGTNAYHGNLVYRYNGTILNANDFFANAAGVPRPETVSNQYAASFGGPVITDKMFFFVDTEGHRSVLPNGNQVVTIPSPAFQSYTLRTIQPVQVPFYQKMFELYNNAPGVGRAVPVTAGNSPLQDSSGGLGCGALAGTPTGAGGVFGVDVPCALAWDTNSSSLTSEWLLSGRLDYNFSANQRVFLRFRTDQAYGTANPSHISPLFDIVGHQPEYEGQVNHTLVITPSLVNNIIGAVTYFSYVTSVDDLSAALRAFPDRIAINDGGSNGGGMTPVGPPNAVPFGHRAGEFQIIDDISYSTGRHFFRAGVNYRYNPEDDLADAHVSVGKFSFFRFDEFAGGALTGHSASSFSQTFNFNADPVFRIHLYNFGAYVQDQWAPTPHLKVTATIRFERTGNPYCVNRCFARFTEPFPSLGKSLSIPYNQSIQAGQGHAFYGIEPIIPEPRFSLAYSPGWSRGTVFRAGVGLFSDLYPAFFAGTLGGNPPDIFFSRINAGLINAGGPGSLPSIATASANAFQSGFANGDTLTQIQQAVAPAPFGPPSYYSIPSTVRSPKSLQWNFEVQRQLGTDNVLALRYMGNHGYDIFVTDPNANASADPALYPNGFAGLPKETPDPRFAVVQQLTNNGYANYHALLINFRRTLGHGFQGQISYAWSHALDTLSNGGLLPFSYDSQTGQINPFSLQSLNYSNADYDARHNLTGDFIWEMPSRLIKNRLMNSIFGRWSFGTKLSAHTGTPFSVTNSAAFPSATFGGVVLADVVDPTIHTVCGSSAVDKPCFAVTQFAPAATQADFGNLPRNSFRGPGYFNIDSSLFKTIPVSERLRLTFGASDYNLLIIRILPIRMRTLGSLA